MRAARAAVGILLVTLTAGGCGGDSPATPTADQLAGSWRLVSIRPLGQSEQSTPAGAAYSVMFADGRVSLRADCNTCSGVFSLSGQTLTAGPTLICTRAACPTMAFENVFTQLMTGDSTISLSANSLVLTSSRGTVRLTR